MEIVKASIIITYLNNKIVTRYINVMLLESYHIFQKYTLLWLLLIEVRITLTSRLSECFKKRSSPKIIRLHSFYWFKSIYLIQEQINLIWSLLFWNNGYLSLKNRILKRGTLRIVHLILQNIGNHKSFFATCHTLTFYIT